MDGTFIRFHSLSVYISLRGLAVAPVLLFVFQAGAPNMGVKENKRNKS